VTAIERKHTLTSSQVETLTLIQQQPHARVVYGRAKSLLDRKLIIPATGGGYALTWKGLEALEEQRA
jgi:hypothetical protein